jgi:hypothetical protein
MIVHHFWSSHCGDVSLDGPKLMFEMKNVMFPGGPEITFTFNWMGPCIGVLDVTFELLGRRFLQRYLHNVVIHDGGSNTLHHVKLLVEEDTFRFPRVPKRWFDYAFAMVASGLSPLIEKQDDPIWANRIHLENPDLTRPERGVGVMHRWVERFYPESFVAKHPPKARLRQYAAE